MYEGGALVMAARLDGHFTVAKAVIVRLRLLRLRLTNVAQGGCVVIEVYETGGSKLIAAVEPNTEIEAMAALKTNVGLKLC